jgi:hypothetical protein
MGVPPPVLYWPAYNMKMVARRGRIYREEMNILRKQIFTFSTGKEFFSYNKDFFPT